MYIKNLGLALLVATLGLGAGLSGCEKHDDPGEKASESVKDALNMRDNEKLKDAGEDMKDAAKDAGDAVKEKAEDVKEDVQK
jgi:hypothetical protein